MMKYANPQVQTAHSAEAFIRHSSKGSGCNESGQGGASSTNGAYEVDE